MSFSEIKAVSSHCWHPMKPFETAIKEEMLIRKSVTSSSAVFSQGFKFMYFLPSNDNCRITNTESQRSLNSEKWPKSWIKNKINDTIHFFSMSRELLIIFLINYFL